MTPARTQHRWRRRVAASLTFAATIFAAGFMYLVGAFSDFSGQHRMPPQTIGAAIAILIVGWLVSLWVLRRGT
jgi:protein-S-isoprenylcysteine O-methyltransferase Ste14